MMKNMFNKNDVEQLIQRVQHLTPHHKAQWGSMNPAEMLLHCNMIHGYLLSPSVTPTKKTSLKEYLSRWVVLYVLPHLPKHVKAPKQVHTKGLINEEAFEKEREKFISFIHRFVNEKPLIEHRHPYFGNLKTKEWGIACWKHNDHHLRQFGV
jgi:hypothetical protein